MIGGIASIDRVDDHGVVRRPMPTDALGAALRDVYSAPATPDDMLRLIRVLDTPTRRH